MGDRFESALVGAAAGGATAFLFWAAFRFAIDRQVTQTIDREVPPRIRSELDAKLRQIGLTPEVGAAIRSLSTNLERAGVWRALQETAR